MFVDTNAAPADGTNDAGMEFDESKYPKFSDIKPEEATPEQITELVKAGQTLLGQTKHWSAKAKTLAAQVKPDDKTIKPNPVANEGDMGSLRADVEDLKTEREKRQFGHSHSLSPEETDRAFALAKGMGKKPTEILEDDFFKSGLQSLRDQQRAAGAIPGPSSRSPMVDGKSFSELKREDKIKNFDKFVASSAKRR